MTNIEFRMHGLFTELALIVSRLNRVYQVCNQDNELQAKIQVTLKEAKGLHQMIHPYASMLDNKEILSAEVKLVILDIITGGSSWAQQVRTNFCMYFSKNTSFAA